GKWRFCSVPRKPPDFDPEDQDYQGHPNQYRVGLCPEFLKGPGWSKRCLRSWLEHCADETIATPRKGLHESRVVRVISQRGSNLANRCIQRLVKIYECIFGPHLLTQLFPSDQLARTGQQDGADLKWLALQ